MTPVDALTFTECMEQLQEGYVASVAATAGCLYNRLPRDSYGFDTLIVKKRPPPFEELSFYAQLKCTTTIKPSLDKDFFSFRLKKREYFERLAVRRKGPKAILVVMVTSPVQTNWTHGSHDSLSLLHCCYWVSLEGRPVPAATQPTVDVPVANVFDAGALEYILATLDEGGDIHAATGTNPPKAE